MCKKLTPAEAFKHVKALWPETTVLLKNAHGWTARNATESFMAAGTSGINIDWAGEDCYPVPVKVTYREPTLEDIKNGTDVEFSGSAAFGVNAVVRGKLQGFLRRHGSLMWQQFDGIYWSYCRVPVKIPAGWREITEGDKITYGEKGDDPNCDLMSISGEFAGSCYRDHNAQWKVYGGQTVKFTPVYIRKAQ